MPIFAVPAMLKEVQYDHLGSEIAHVDFERINLEEVVRVQVAIETHGTPKGAKSGGILELVHKHLTVECKAGDIPNEIVAEVSELEIGQALTVGQLAMPAGVKVLDDAGAIVAIVQEPRAELEPTVEAAATATEMAEPEVITARKEEEEETEEEEEK